MAIWMMKQGKPWRIGVTGLLVGINFDPLLLFRALICGNNSVIIFLRTTLGECVFLRAMFILTLHRPDWGEDRTTFVHELTHAYLEMEMEMGDLHR
jgi:hypothetical protein